MADEANHPSRCARCAAPIYEDEPDCHYCGGRAHKTPWDLMLLGAVVLVLGGLAVSAAITS